MLRKNSQRLCKLAACLVALAVVCYTFGKCDDFVSFRRLDGFTNQLNKLLPQLNTVLKSRLNNTVLAMRREGDDLKTENGSYLRERDEKIANGRDTHVKPQNPEKDNFQSKQERNHSENDFSRQTDLIKLFVEFTERQNFEAERRQSQFETILKNVTKILVDIHQKRQEGSLVVDAHKNTRKQSDKSVALVGNKPNNIGQNTKSLTRTPFTSHAVAEQSETTPKEDLTFRNEKEVINRIRLIITVKDFSTKIPVISRESQRPTISVSEISSPKNESPEKMSRKELTVRNKNESISTIKSTMQTHIAFKTPAPSNQNQKPNKSVDRSAQIVPKTDLSQPNNYTSASKVNYTNSTTENLFRSRGKSIFTSQPSYNDFTAKTNLALTKTNSKSQITKNIKNLTSLKAATPLMDQNTLNRQAEVFLRKIKNFGIAYNESVFHYKGQSNSGIFYREVSPVAAVKNKPTIFLLHDSHYDSKTWLSIGTLYHLATHGYRVIALDLPGHGQSKNLSEPHTSIEKLKLLVSLMLAVTPKSSRVIVTPGESGLYSVPMVMSASVMLKAVVFISTRYTGKYPTSSYENVHIPALVVYGENDNTAFLGEYLESMNRLPNSKRFRSIQNGGHYCYLEQPEVFHQLMTEFLSRVSQRDKTRKRIQAQK